ncbi:pyridoxal phosphate-dependent decarboxylase family protein [Telluribacter sp.]|jgi:L-2,4-diaminobutyrate decarboxylase|uniref:pyridoxal phosphate-dependent decarboxylase family protein n=1 Tax=Telluribacter sp. TaxID=1978767 RepID=UPI002E0D34CF|nr:aminotransferase class I/II-fold pyridoxal phosphate-dependent enzyme [Telluribacter sp.]
MLNDAYSADTFRTHAHQLVDLLSDYLQQTENRQLEKVIPYQSPDDSLAYWNDDFAQGPGDVDDFFRKVIKQSTHLHHPRYMGHQVCPPLPIAAMAGLLTGLLNNGMAVYEMGLVSNPLERIVSELLARRIGFDEKSSGLLTSGGTLANLTALLAARAAKAPGDVWQHGSQERLAVMVSAEAHYCIDRSARIMGFGEGGIIKIPVNAQFQMRTDLLEQYYQQATATGLTVIAVIASASSTSTGAYDNLEAVADFCDKHSLWLHIDGAHGGGVVFSDTYRHLVKGMDRANSVVIDWHKMLMTPALATSLIFRRNEDSFRTFHQQAQYLWASSSEDWFNSGKRTFECTKLMMSVKIYAILKAYGEAIFTENVDRLYDLARQFADRIRQHPQLQLAVSPQSNIVCFRYSNSASADLNQANSQIRQELLQEGRFYIVQTTLHGEVYLRVSLMNPLTTLDDLDDLLGAILAIVPVPRA